MLSVRSLPSYFLLLFFHEVYLVILDRINDLNDIWEGKIDLITALVEDSFPISCCLMASPIDDVLCVAY